MSTPPGPSVSSLSAVEMADALLAVVSRENLAVMLLEPSGGRHAVLLGHDDALLPDERLPETLGDAVALRLALLAGVDPWAVGGRIGRLSVLAGDRPADYFLVLRTANGHHGVELRRAAAAPARAQTQRVGAPQAPERIGPYRVEALLGRGGMAVVHRAVQESSGRVVAVKVLHGELAADPAIALQFVREGRAASLAHHPGIVSVIDFGTLDDGRAYLVMELVDSPTLEAALGSTALEPVRAARIARRICLALEAAHVRGVVHGDLKPANVFLGANDDIKIADFGAARLETAAPGDTVTQIVVGTPLYMSPEQARGLRTDGRSDLYALGCMLFRMLTGRLPFRGSSHGDVLFRHLTEPVPPVTGPLGPIPAALQAVVLKSLAKAADERFQSAGEMAAAIDQAFAGMPMDERRGPRP